MTFPAPKQLFETAITDASAALDDIEGAGTLRWDGANVYRWVYNATGTATVVGEVVYHDMSADPNSTLVESVYKCDTLDFGMMAGVCMSIVAATGYGWIQIFGVCTSVIVIENESNITAIGDYLKGVTGQVYVVRDAAAQPQYSRNIQALVVNTSSTSTVTALIACQVNCL